MIPARSFRWYVMQRASRQELDTSSYVDEGLQVDNAHIWYLSIEFRYLRGRKSVKPDDPHHQGSRFSFKYISHGPRYYSTLIERFTWSSEPIREESKFESKAYWLAHISDTASSLTFCIRNMYSDAWWSQRSELRSKALRERVELITMEKTTH